MSRRSAISLLETIVVISIVSLLISLSLGGIAQVRSAAIRTQCLNNLRQLALAMHDYHDIKGALPSGTESNLLMNSQPYSTWLRKILPHLEQVAMSAEIDRAFILDRDFRNLDIHTHRRTGMPAFVCPLDPRGLVSTNPRLLPNGIGLTSYLGMEGTNQRTKDGVLFYGSRVRFADVHDGLSNTAMIGERPPSATQRYGWWYAGWGMNREGTLDGTLGCETTNTDIAFCPSSMPFAAGSLKNECDSFHFWSLHPGGAHFVLCDGSIRFLSYDIGSNVLRALATSQSGD